VKIIFLSFFLLMSACKKRGEYAGNYDHSGFLSIEEDSMQPVPKIRDSETAGSTAEEMGFYSQSDLVLQNETGFNFLGLNQDVPGRIRLGARVCIGASYGEGGETAVRCGKGVLCQSMKGEVHRSINWSPNEVCFQQDCLPARQQNGEYIGMEAQGTDSSIVCNDNDGVPSLLSLTRYFADIAKYGLGHGNSTNASSSLDRLYGSTRGMSGNTRIGMVSETLYNGPTLKVKYSTSGTSLAGGNLDSTAELFLMRKKGFAFAFYEAGSSAQAVSLTGSEKHSGPSSEALGLTRTRRGNVFQLAGGGEGPGAEGAAKVVVQD